MEIYHKIGIRAKEEEVISALKTQKGLTNWWTKEVSGDFNSGISTIGGSISFGFGHGNAIIMNVQNVTSNQVLWECTSGPVDWVGSHIDFRLNLITNANGENMVLLYFEHKDWRNVSEFTAHCSMKWATFLLSLKNYIENGVGNPSPNDIKIDDIN
ncbi:SRPBCC domain-containing protein [Leptospira sp. WS39.C2]